MKRITETLARELNVIGLLNIQFAIQGDTVFVIEVNPRASRTLPFVSKATGVQLAQIATHVMLGTKLTDTQIRPFDPKMRRVAIKESVFPFVKFPKVNVFLGPEMRSTGEVMGMDSSFGRAIVKSHLSAGITLPDEGAVFISLSPHDKTERAVDMVRGYAMLGFTILATRGTAEFLNEYDVAATPVLKHYEGRPSIVDQIANGEVQIVINTPMGETARFDEAIMGHTAMKYKVPFFTTLAAAEASVSGILAKREESFSASPLQEYYAADASGH